MVLMVGTLSLKSPFGTDRLLSHRFMKMNGYAPRRILRPAACGPTCFCCATLIKHIRARICECRFLGSSHHASNTGICSYAAIIWNHRIHGMQTMSQRSCHAINYKT